MIHSLSDLHDAQIQCRACPRLVAWREEVARTKRRAFLAWDYWGKPVPGWGDAQARLLLLGLAPGAHGSNRTGRPFTGDGSGDFLFAALHRAAFANQPKAICRDDDLQLTDCYITAVARCAPPQNKPTGEEIATCRPWLVQELGLLPQVQVVLCLGRIAWDGYLKLLKAEGVDVPRLAFSHGAHTKLPAGLPHLMASYHPSLQNTNTGRLTPPMMDEIFLTARSLFNPPPKNHQS